MEAQFALVTAGRDDLLTTSAQSGQPELAQLHAIWGLGQFLRNAPGVGSRDGASGLSKLRARVHGVLLARLTAAPTKPGDDEARAQAAKVLGEGPGAEATTALATALADKNPRVRFFAAQSLARLKAPGAKESVVAMLAANQDSDPFLRHAGVMALAGGSKAEDLAALGTHASASVRLAATVALRRQASELVAAFLTDKDPAVAREAARAINDVPIEGATSALAKLASLPVLPTDDVVLSRAVEANFREGTAQAATLLARIAADAKVAVHTRQEAVAALGDFASPQPRDRLTGAYRPLPKQNRDGKAAAEALGSVLNKLLARKQPEVFQTTSRAVAELKLMSAVPLMARAVAQRWDNEDVRVAALEALNDLKAPELAAVLPIASKDPSPRVRLWALKARVVANPALAPALVSDALNKGVVQEKQAAIGILGWVQDPGASVKLSSLLDKLVTRRLPEALWLDVEEAAKKRNEPALTEKLAAYEKSRPTSEFGPYVEAVDGGDPEAGRRTFLYNNSVQCRRCHSVEGHGGEVGPELKTVGRRRSRKYLLESVVFPSKHFAPGFESALVTMKDGAIHGGTVKQDTPKALELTSAEEGPLTLIKKDIASREPGASGMPDGFGSILTKRELRDLVAFLAAQK